MLDFQLLLCLFECISLFSFLYVFVHEWKHVWYIHKYVKVYEEDMSVHVSGGYTHGDQKRAYYLEPEIQASMN